MSRQKLIHIFGKALLVVFLIGCSAPSSSVSEGLDQPTIAAELAPTPSPAPTAISSLFPIFQNDRAGFIDVSGALVIQSQFDDAKSFSEGLAPVLVKEQWGYISPQGAIVVQPTYAVANNFYSGRARVKVGEKFGFIDQGGKLVIAADFDDAYDFSEGLAKVIKCTEQKTCTWINLNFEWGSISYPTGGEQSYIDPDGNTVISAAFDLTSSFHGGLAAVKSGDRWGYIDTNGALVIQPQFEAAYDFSEGM